MAARNPVQNTLTDRARAFELINKLSFFRGNYILASGKESKTYLDMKPTMFDPEGATLLARLVWDRIKTLKADYVGGLEMGAVPLLSNIVMLSYMAQMPIRGLFVRKATKDHGTKKLIEGINDPSDLKGKTVVILDDVTTTGGSAMEAVNAITKAGGNVALVLSIVDRGEGAVKFYSEKDIPFEYLFRLVEFEAA